MVCNSTEAGVFLGSKIELRERGSKAPGSARDGVPGLGLSPIQASHPPACAPGPRAAPSLEGNGLPAATDSRSRW